MASLIQWNVRGLAARRNELRQLINEVCPTVLAIQETFLSNPGAQSFPSYNSFDVVHSGINNHPCGGVSILVKENIRCSRISITCSLQAVAVRVEIPRKITVCSLYLPHPTWTKNQLCALIDQLPPPYLILCDSNSHHQVWGHHFTDTPGRILDEIIAEKNLHLFNDGSVTYMSPSTGSVSAIDVSFGSLELAPWFHWKVDSDLRGSDHYPIVLSPPQPSPSFKIWPRWKFDNLNWEPFRNHIQNSIRQDEINSPESFTEMVREAARNNIPRTNGTMHSHPVPWWNDDVKKAVKSRRKALRKLRKHKKEDTMKLLLLESYHQANTESKKIIRSAKQASWREYISGISSVTSPTEVWRRIRSLKGGRNAIKQPMIEEDGIVHDDPRKVAEVLVDHFAEITSDDLYNLRFRKRKYALEQFPAISPSVSDPVLDRDFTIEEFLYQLDKLKGSSPGPDEIHNKMLQNLPASAKIKLLQIFNKCWGNGVFPDIWKEGHAIAIAKPGKDQFKPENQRMIVLNSTPGKLLERMISRRLTTLLEERQLLDPRQFAFRRGRSTTDHLALLEDFTRRAWNKKEHVEAAFVDITKAYDRTCRRIILNQLVAWGIGGKMFKFLENFMKDREVRVRIGNHLSSPRVLENGVVQGSVLSVILFLIAISSIFQKFDSRFQIIVYADDIVILVAHKDPVYTRKLLKKAFRILNIWSQETGFEISSDKTKAMHLCRSSDHNCFGSPVKFRGTRIEFVNQQKILGITMDRKLTFRAHAEETKIECLKRLKIIRWCGGVRYGGEQRTVIRLYNALVQSKLIYAYPAWSSISNSAKKKLFTIQTQGIRLATGAFRSSPTESVLIDAGELPLRLRMEMVLVCFAAKVKASPTIYLDPNIFAVKRGEIVASKRGISLPEVSTRNLSDELWKFKKPRICLELWSKNNTTRGTHVLRNKFCEIRNTVFEDHEIFFTDGSKSIVGTGCSIVSPALNKSARLPDVFSVFSAEAQAILWAVEKADGLNSKTVIFSDSMSVLQAVQNSRPTHPLIIQIASICRRNRNITLCWVPAHVGIIGNEIADKEAKIAAANDCIQHISIPLTDICKEFKRKFLTIWEEEWSNSDQKLSKIKRSTKRWDSSNRHSRWEEVVISRLRIGHSRLTHGHLMGGLESSICDVCEVPLSVEHILIDCHKYNETREHYSINSCIELALGDDESKIKKLLEYLKDTRLIYEI